MATEKSGGANLEVEGEETKLPLLDAGCYATAECGNEGVSRPRPEASRNKVRHVLEGVSCDWGQGARGFETDGEHVGRVYVTIRAPIFVVLILRDGSFRACVWVSRAPNFTASRCGGNFAAAVASCTGCLRDGRLPLLLQARSGSPRIITQRGKHDYVFW